MASRLNFSTGAIVNPLEGLQQAVTSVGNVFDKYVQREQDREDRLAREAEDRRRHESQLARYDRQEQESLRRYEEGKELNRLEREEASRWKEKEFGLRESEAKQRSEAAEQTRRLNSLILEEKEGDRKAATLMSSPEFKAQIKDAYLNSEDANKGLLAVGNEINKGGLRVQAVVNSTFDALPGVKPEIKPDDLQGRLKYLEDVANTSTDLTVKSAAENAIASHNAFYKDLAGLRSTNYDQSSGSSTSWGTGRNNENSRLDSLIHNVAATADKETVYDLARQQALASGASVAGADKAAEYATRGMMTQAERTAATLKQLKAEAEILGEVNPKGKGSVNVNVSGGSGGNSTVDDGEKSVNTNPFATASNLANKLSYSPGVGTDAAPKFSSLVTPLIEKHKAEGVPVDSINDALQEVYLSGSGNVRDKGNFDIDDKTAAAIFAKHANKPKPISQPNTLKTSIESRLAAININPEVARSLAVVDSAMPSLGNDGLARTGEQRAVKFVQDLKAVPTSSTTAVADKPIVEAGKELVANRHISGTVKDLSVKALAAGINPTWVVNTAERGDVESLQHAINAGTSSEYLALGKGVVNTASALGKGVLGALYLGGSSALDMLLNGANWEQAGRNDGNIAKWIASGADDLILADKQFSAAIPALRNIK